MPCLLQSVHPSVLGVLSLRHHGRQNQPSAGAGGPGGGDLQRPGVFLSGTTTPISYPNNLKLH